MKFENFSRNPYFLIFYFYIHSYISQIEEQTVRVSVRSVYLSLCVCVSVCICVLWGVAGWFWCSSCLLHTCIFIMCLQNMMETHNEWQRQHGQKLTNLLCMSECLNVVRMNSVYVHVSIRYVPTVCITIRGCTSVSQGRKYNFEIHCSYFEQDVLTLNLNENIYFFMIIVHRSWLENYW